MQLRWSVNNKDTVNVNRVYGNPGIPKQPGSVGTALLLQILSHALLLVLDATII